MISQQPELKQGVMLVATYRGIDVSKHQGVIDWAKVKASGISFALIRSSARTNYIDPFLDANVKGCEANGIAYGFYHYSYAMSVAGAQAEADYFLKVIGKYNPTMPVYFDLEDVSQEPLGKATLTAMAVAFMDKVEKAGYYTGIYTNPEWLSKYLDYEKIKRFDIWLAAWRNTRPTSPPHGIWQNAVLGSAADVAAKPYPRATKVGSVPGVKGAIDVDIAYKDYPTLIKKLGLNKPKRTYKIFATKSKVTDAQLPALLKILETNGFTITQEVE